MAKKHKPRAGSRAFWPKKRAKRIYPNVRASSGAEGCRPLIFAGYKAGMSQVFFVDTRKDTATSGQEICLPTTVLDCPPLSVCGLKAYKKSVSGLKNTSTILSDSLSKDLKRRTSIPKKKNLQEKIAKLETDVKENKIDDIRLLVNTNPRASFGKKKPELFEIDLSGSLEEKLAYAKERLGKEIKLEEVFSNGEYVDVCSVSKGKGYQGAVKRFGIKISSRKNKGKMRHVGTMGPVTPARVLPGRIAQAGQLGFQTRTEYNKRILKISREGPLNPAGGFINYGSVKGDYALIQGSVPGPKKRLIILRKGNRAPEPAPIEISAVSTESQQGV